MTSGRPANAFWSLTMYGPGLRFFLTAVLASGTLRCCFAASRPGTRSRFNLEFADLLLAELID
jgi:hypothetical protein